MQGEKVGRQGGRSSQEQPRREIMKGNSGNKLEIMKGDKLGRQGGSGGERGPERKS